MSYEHHPLLDQLSLMNIRPDPEEPLPYDDEPMKDHGWDDEETELDESANQVGNSDEEE